MDVQRARAYAEHCYDQNLAAAADHVRRLFADDPQFLISFTRLANMDAVSALSAIASMDKRTRNDMIAWLIPFARIGLAAATFEADDKYGVGDL